MGLFGGGNSSSETNNVLTTNTENNAYDNRVGASDNAIIVGQDGSFRVTNNSSTDARNQAVQVGDGMYVGPGGTLNVLDGGAIDAARQAAEAAAAASRAAVEEVRAATRPTRQTPCGQSYDAALGTIGNINADALDFGKGIVSDSFGFGDRALIAINDAVKTTVAQSGDVVNTALQSLLDADKSSEERAFGNITSIRTLTIAAAVAFSLYAIARYGK